MFFICEVFWTNYSNLQDKNKITFSFQNVIFIEDLQINLAIVCLLDVDECAIKKPCKNGATCTNTRGGYTCTCAGKWFTGKHCDQGRTIFGHVTSVYHAEIVWTEREQFSKESFVNIRICEYQMCSAKWRNISTTWTDWSLSGMFRYLRMLT